MFVRLFFIRDIWTWENKWSLSKYRKLNTVKYLSCQKWLQLLQRIQGYRISGHFRNDIIFAFFATSFKSQIIENTETISCIIFYKKLFKSQKMTDTNKKCYRFSPFSQILWHVKKIGYTVINWWHQKFQWKYSLKSMDNYLYYCIKC